MHAAAVLDANTHQDDCCLQLQLSRVHSSSGYLHATLGMACKALHHDLPPQTGHNAATCTYCIQRCKQKITLGFLSVIGEVASKGPIPLSL